MKTIDVLVIGRSCLDYLAVVEKFPQENKKAPLEFRIIEGGGQGERQPVAFPGLAGKSFASVNLETTGKEKSA